MGTPEHMTKRCRHLQGLRQELGTVYGHATRDNGCLSPAHPGGRRLTWRRLLHLGRPAWVSVSLEHQQAYCLSTSHPACPHYVVAAPVS